MRRPRSWAVVAGRESGRYVCSVICLAPPRALPTFAGLEGVRHLRGLRPRASRLAAVQPVGYRRRDLSRVRPRRNACRRDERVQVRRPNARPRPADVVGRQRARVDAAAKHLRSDPEPARSGGHRHQLARVLGVARHLGSNHARGQCEKKHRMVLQTATKTSGVCNAMGGGFSDGAGLGGCDFLAGGRCLPYDLGRMRQVREAASTR